MAIHEVIKSSRIDLNSLNAYADFMVAGATLASVQVDVVSGSWGSTVITIKRANTSRGTDFYGLHCATTMSAAGFQSEEFIDTSNINRLVVQVTTAAGSAAIGQITCCFKTED